MKAIRVGLCLLLAFSVLALGAVDVWSESILEIGAAALFALWALLVYRDSSAKIEWNPLNCPILGVLGIGFLQLVFRGTAYPFLTRNELLKLCAYFLIFFLTTQVFTSRKDLGRLAWFVILFCFGVSLFGIIQYFTAGTEIYWMSGLRMASAPFGPYVNRNHFAGFVELTLPVGLALMAFRGLRRDLVPLTTLLTIVPISAIMLSGSRGGIISFGFEVGVLALLVRRKRALDRSGLTAIAIVALAAVALVVWVGAGSAIEKFMGLNGQDVSLNRRASMFRGAARIFLDHPIKGSGLGTLIDVYPRYETAYDGKVVNHVHNDYIEMLAETGLLGGLCGAMFLWILYREALKNFMAEQGHFSRGLHAGGIVALTGMLVHSFVDFNLHVPSNALLFLLQAYLVTSPLLPSDTPGSRSRRRPRVGEGSEGSLPMIETAGSQA